MTLLPERRRGRRISVRLSPPEHDRLDAFATRTGLTLSAFVRQVLTGAKPPRAARRPPVEKVMLGRLLAELGTLTEKLTTLLSVAARDRADTVIVIERDLRRTLADLRGAASTVLAALGRTGRP
jgi:hypothetical protein